ncbi:1-acylglycerol-3-phosphate O-acyltransferase [Aliiglaciecola sp. LCG003]|uniref:1-acylglycerol-3-phosphate O-acyltransferase n=1 Tax=Aliiglaciecola sp. LCG003 TaxID=3053655 RepID=UPI0025738501|nr:1-acylglycerol-3-phosphate O-acyltransferase [Aliiglaciecola sp. LCG003]WJG10073.1 1-acylglycerol-3-phosphate O-acyltransferase [Aliiglaciecola sp. LCG003]
MLAVIRIIIVFIYFILASVGLILLCIVRPFHRDNVYVIGHVYGKMAGLVGIKVKITVPMSVKNQGPHVFIANHQNSYDLITVCASAQKGMVTVGKKSLVWIPVFGWLYWLSGNILIDRKNKGKAHDTLKQTADIILHRRLSVFFFPEGTRSYGRGLLPFKTGAFRIAKAVNEPVVMVCTSNLHQKVKLNRWNNGSLLIELCEPVKIDDSRDAKQWADFFHQKMSEKIRQLDAQVALVDKVK